MNFWQGKIVKLRGIETKDTALLFGCNNDSEMAQGMDYIWFPVAKEFVKAWIKTTSEQGPNNDNFNWVIENIAGEAVGAISTNHCNSRVGSFQYGISIFKEHQRKGYASEAILLVLRYFFNELRYQKVTINIHSFNLQSIRLHEHLGFQLEGQLRRVVFTHGQHYDDLMYGITVEEFRDKHSESLPFFSPKFMQKN